MRTSKKCGVKFGDDEYVNYGIFLGNVSPVY